MNQANFLTQFLNVLRDVILNGTLVYVFLLFIHVVVLVSSLLSIRRIASYLLGWLIAAFSIFALAANNQDFQLGADSSIYTGAADLDPTLTILVPAMLGLSVGFLTLTLMRLNRGEGRSSTASMLITVTYSSATVIAAILMGSAPITLRSMIASFVFAFMAGILIYLMVGLGQRKAVPEAETEAESPQIEDKTQKPNITRIKLQEVGSDKARTIRPKQDSQSRRSRN